jgi:hypothetical protein
MKTPFDSHHLKEMVDEMESIRVDKLWYYNVATNNTKDVCRSLSAIIHDDDKHRLVLCDIAYKDQVESGTKFLQSRRCQEKERLDEYIVYKEKAIAARKMQRDQEVEERGGLSYDILSRLNLVWIPGSDHYFGYAQLVSVSKPINLSVIVMLLF